MTQKNPEQLFPLFLTCKLDETKRFYTEVAGFSVETEMPTYLQVRSPEPGAPQLCFMKPDAFPDGKERPQFDGHGVIVSVPTQNADELCKTMTQRGAKPLSQPEDKPWGWRSFFVADPNGLVLDFFHQRGAQTTAANAE